MALTVGELRVQLEARTQAFRRALTRAQTQVTTFATRSRAALAGVGRGFARLGQSIRALAVRGGIAAALGGAVAVAGLASLAKNAIAASAAFEGFGVRLRGFLGSQEEANAALETFTELSSETPFAVAQIVEGAASLASAALGNRQRLEELTQTAANLAAVSGLSFQEAASNLARSLQAGIGAADLFRERGVRALIESIGEIPDATKLSAQELDDAFRDVFGADGGTFGDAAQALSVTLGGALSNIGDAATNFRVQLGDALSPVAVNAARNVFIPFFQNLQTLVSDNQEAIRTFAAGALSSLVRAFTLSARAGLFFADSGAAIRQFIIDLTGALFEAELSVKRFNVAITRAFDFFGLAPDTGEGSLEAQLRQLELAEASAQAVADAAGEAQRDTDQFREALADLGTELENLDQIASSSNLSAAIPTFEGGPTADDLAGAAAAKVEKQKELLALQRQQQQGARVLVGLETQRAREAAALEGPLAAQVFAIEQQKIALQEATLTEDDRIRANELINTLIAEQNALLERQSAAQAAVPGLESGVEGLIASLNRTDPEAAQRFSDELDALIAQSLGPEAQAQALRELTREVQRAIADAKLTPLEQKSADAVNAGFTSAFQGGGLKGGLQSFADSLTETTEASMAEGFKKAVEGLTKDLSTALDGAFGGVGGALGSAIGSLAGPLISAALQGSGGGQASAANVTSAITSAQQVRGVSAGPSSIGIAQVGRSIQEAFVEPERLLRLIAASNERIAASTTGGTTSTFASVDEATNSLVNDGPSLI